MAGEENGWQQNCQGKLKSAFFIHSSFENKAGWNKMKDDTSYGKHIIPLLIIHNTAHTFSFLYEATLRANFALGFPPFE